MIIMSVTISTYKLCLVRFHLQFISYLHYWRLFSHNDVLHCVVFVFVCLHVASFSVLSMFDFPFGIL
jgi:hypothetical protein